jgi:crossover junction endodeoxyribonuclease RusA
MEASFELPYPPSVNTYWRMVRGRMLISKKGKIYRECAQHVTQVKFGADRCQVLIYAYPPDHRKRDLDNICKAILDAIGRAGIYDDDSQIDRLTVLRRKVVKGGRIFVSIYSLDK